MDLNRNALSIILDRYKGCIWIDLNIDVGHGPISLVVVSRVDQYLIKYFIESRYKCDLAVLEFASFFVPYPACLLLLVNGADI